MKAIACRFGLWMAAAAGILMAAFVLFQAVSSAYRFYPFVKMPPLMEHFVAGELINGKVVEQRLSLTEEDLAVAIPPESSFCVGALMATYYDRDNKAGVRFRVRTPDRRVWVQDVPFAAMKDNRYQKICFELPFKNLRPGEYSVRLEGVGGQAGSSASVWLTRYRMSPYDSVAYVDGKPSDGILAIGFSARERAPLMQVPVLILVVLYAALIGLLVLVLFPRKRVPDR